MAVIVEITVDVSRALSIENGLQIMICLQEPIDFADAQVEQFELFVQIGIYDRIKLNELIEINGLAEAWATSRSRIRGNGIVFPTPGSSGTAELSRPTQLGISRFLLRSFG